MLQQRVDPRASCSIEDVVHGITPQARTPHASQAQQCSPTSLSAIPDLREFIRFPHNNVAQVFASNMLHGFNAASSAIVSALSLSQGSLSNALIWAAFTLACVGMIGIEGNA